LQRAFAKGKHDLDYAMAFRDVSEPVRLMRCALTSLFRPVIPVERMGFKEICVRGKQTLDGLNQLFPKADFIFLFRDPRTQWPSVKLRDWEQSKDIEIFLKQYQNLAKIYMDFSDKFVEDKAIKANSVWEKLLKHLDLSSIDSTLIDDKLRATKNAPELTREEIYNIEGSEAFVLYQEMRMIAGNWLGPY
jgi:hypothetical protein